MTKTKRRISWGGIDAQRTGHELQAMCASICQCWRTSATARLDLAWPRGSRVEPQDHHLFSRKAFMKTLDEVLTKYGHNWLLQSLKDQDCQMVHLVDVGALQDCLRGSPKVQGATFASGQPVPMSRPTSRATSSTSLKTGRRPSRSTNWVGLSAWKPLGRKLFSRWISRPTGPRGMPPETPSSAALRPSG